MRSRSAYLLSACLLLASCGGGSGSSSSPSSAGAQPVTIPTTTPTPTPTPTPPPVLAAPEAIAAPVTAFGYTLAPAARATRGNTIPLGKCVNMGGELERDVEGNLTGRPIKDGDFAIIRQAGFDTIRLPVKYSVHAGTAPPYTIDPAFMARVAHVVDTAVAAGLNIIIDLHSYDELLADPYGQRDRYVAIWRQVAEAHQGNGPKVWFELLNEPGDQFWSKVSTWEVFTPAIAAIRETNPTRPIIVAGGLGSRVESLATFNVPLDDPNLVPTFHFYDPKEFTHQGAKWTTIAYPLGRALAESDHQPIDKAVGLVKAYMARTGRVPFLGEYGAYDIAGVSPEDRVTYYGWVSAAFASAGVQSCAWSWSNGFSLYNYKTGWLPGMLDAIQTTTTLTAG